MRKKITLMVLTVLILQVILPTVSVVFESGITLKSLAVETSEATVDGITWTYTLEDGKATNVKPKDASTLPTEVTIPNTLDGYPVTSIGKYAFLNCSSLTEIVIPNSVTNIGEWAFWFCSSLTSINIPEGVTTIEYNVFYGCSSLISINVEESNQN